MLNCTIIILKSRGHGGYYALIWEFWRWEAKVSSEQKGPGCQPHWMELAFLEGLTQAGHSRVWLRTSKLSSSLSHPSRPPRPRHSLPSQIRHGQDSSICHIHPQPDCSKWGQLWASPGHHHLPYPITCPSDLQRFQETRYFCFNPGRYFKKPELRFSCYFGGVPLEDN